MGNLKWYVCVTILNFYFSTIKLSISAGSWEEKKSTRDCFMFFITRCLLVQVVRFFGRSKTPELLYWTSFKKYWYNFSIFIRALIMPTCSLCSVFVSCIEFFVRIADLFALFWGFESIEVKISNCRFFWRGWIVFGRGFLRYWIFLENVEKSEFQNFWKMCSEIRNFSYNLCKFKEILIFEKLYPTWSIMNSFSLQSYIPVFRSHHPFWLHFKFP